MLFGGCLPWNGSRPGVTQMSSPQPNTETTECGKALLRRQSLESKRESHSWMHHTAPVVHKFHVRSGKTVLTQWPGCMSPAHPVIICYKSIELGRVGKSLGRTCRLGSTEEDILHLGSPSTFNPQCLLHRGNVWGYQCLSMCSSRIHRDTEGKGVYKALIRR